MKLRSYWLALLIGCVIFAITQFGFHLLWENETVGRALINTFFTTVIWGVIMAFGYKFPQHQED